MEITHDNYQIQYDETSGTITYQGSLRLRGEEYNPILDLLISAADARPQTVTLDVRELRFINSSGINTLSKFILQVRNNKASRVIIHSSRQYPWQQKSLSNFQRLMPELQMEID